jgi:hypothetical protein
MNKVFALCVSAIALTASTAFAQLGPAPDKGVLAGYNPTTGEIIVSAGGVFAYEIKATDNSNVFLPANINQAAMAAAIGGSVTVEPSVIGGFSLTNLTHTDLSWGLAAVTGLAEGRLRIEWSPALGSPNQSAPLSLLGGVIPEPTTAVMLGVAMIGVFFQRKRSA